MMALGLLETSRSPAAENSDLVFPSALAREGEVKGSRLGVRLPLVHSGL